MKLNAYALAPAERKRVMNDGSANLDVCFEFLVVGWPSQLDLSESDRPVLTHRMDLASVGRGVIAANTR
jgi:hypothetical protein